MRVENELVIPAPIARVWALTVDIESWSESTPTITSVRRLDDGPLRVGSTARVKQPGQRATLWTVTAVDDQRLFAWEARVLGLRMVASHRLEAAGDGCRNTLIVELHGRGSGLVGRLLRRQIVKTIAIENEGFRRDATAPAATA